MIRKKVFLLEFSLKNQGKGCQICLSMNVEECTVWDIETLIAKPLVRDIMYEALRLNKISSLYTHLFLYKTEANF